MDKAALALFFLGNTLYASAYAVRDILWLRVLTIIGGFSVVPYYLLRDEPLWSAMGWTGIYLAINGFNLFDLLMKRRGIELDDDEALLHMTVFPSFKPRQLRALLNAGSWEDLSHGMQLVRQGEPVERLLLLARGGADVYVNGRRVAQVRDGNFVGEMGFYSGDPASATVVAFGDLRQATWTRAQLDAFFRKEPELQMPFRAAVGVDLSKKLQSTTSGRTKALEDEDNARGKTPEDASEETR